jgi:hypothetical protein
MLAGLTPGSTQGDFRIESRLGAGGMAAAQGATWTDEQAALVVVDIGTDEPAVFFASIPNSLNKANVNTLISSLQLT